MGTFCCWKCGHVHVTSDDKATESPPPCPKCHSPTKPFGCLRQCFMFIVFVLCCNFVLFSCMSGMNDAVPAKNGLAAGRADGGSWASGNKPFPDDDLLEDHTRIRVARWQRSERNRSADASVWTANYLKGFRQGFKTPRHRFMPWMDLPEDEVK